MQPLQYYLGDPAAKEQSVPHAAAAPSNLDAAITMRFAASRRKPARIYARGNTRWQQSCSHSNAICNHRFKKRKELRTQEQPLVAEHRGGTHYIRDRNNRSRTRRTHTRYRTFHRRLQPLYTKKCKVSCSGFLPSTSPMQHSFSHYHAFCSITSQTCTYLRVATPDDNNHAAIPMRSATTDSRNAKNYAHRNNHSLQNTGGTHYFGAPIEL